MLYGVLAVATTIASLLIGLWMTLALLRPFVGHTEPDAGMLAALMVAILGPAFALSLRLTLRAVQAVRGQERGPLLERGTMRGVAMLYASTAVFTAVAGWIGDHLADQADQMAGLGIGTLALVAMGALATRRSRAGARR